MIDLILARRLRQPALRIHALSAPLCRPIRHPASIEHGGRNHFYAPLIRAVQQSSVVTIEGVFGADSFSARDPVVRPSGARRDAGEQPVEARRSGEVVPIGPTRAEKLHVRKRRQEQVRLVILWTR